MPTSTGRGLALLTGPSHSGKTTIARAVMDGLTTPAAYVAIDQIIEGLRLGDGDLWEDGLPVAYAVAAASAEALLERGFVVIVESTFTYVPSPGREPEFHEDEIRRFAVIAARFEAPFLIVRLAADLAELQRRRSGTVRLTPHIVEGTWSLHAERWRDSEIEVLEVDNSARDVAEVAGEVTSALAERFRTQR